MTQETIAAISTAWGEAGIAIVRLSGTNARDMADSILSCTAPLRETRPRVLRNGFLLDECGVEVDHVLAAWFATPHSYTGEDVAEIHTHGGTLVAQLCLRRLLSRGARLAEPTRHPPLPYRCVNRRTTDRARVDHWLSRLGGEQSGAYRWGRSRISLTIRSATDTGSSCSQKRSTSHPRSSSRAVVCLSRCSLPSIFSRQNSMFVTGIEKWVGHLCQKQPSMKTTTRIRVKSRSAVRRIPISGRALTR